MSRPRWLEQWASVDVDALDAGGLEAGLCQLQTAIDRLEAQKTRWVAALDRVHDAKASGRSSTADRLRASLRLSPAQARDQVLAARMLAQLPQVAAAWARGEVGLRHVALIANAADADGDVELAARRLQAVRAVEGELLAVAMQQPLSVLRAAVAQVATAADDRAAAADEFARYRQRHLWVARTRDGMVSGGFKLDQLAGQQLMAALTSQLRPDPPDTPAEQRRSRGQLLADALLELVRSASGQPSCDADGVVADAAKANGRAEVIVIADVAVFEGRGGHAELVGGGPLSGETARRLACDGGIVRVITRGASEVLDVGRKTRVWNPAQERAIVVRDRHCRGPDCTRPIVRFHHVRYWGTGGPTSVANGVGLCEFHHWLVHEGGWTLTISPTRLCRWTDPDGRTHVTWPRPYAAARQAA